MDITKILKKPMTIGIYYIFWVIFQLFPMFLLTEFASRLFSTNVTKMSIVVGSIWGSVVFGLFIHGMSLLYFDKVMAKANQNEISHKVRSYYLNPFVIVLLSFMVGLGIWFLQQKSLIGKLDGRIIIGLFAVIVGTYSMKISDRFEWFVFRDYLDEKY